MHLVDVTVSDEEKKEWNTYNLELFEQQREHYFLDNDSCTHLKVADGSGVGWYKWIMDNLANLQPNLQQLYSSNVHGVKIRYDSKPELETI